jgi:hypothetical protein
MAKEFIDNGKNEGRKKVSFIGRKRGAVGITYRIAEIWYVEEGQYFGDLLYDKFELISDLSVDGIKVSAQELKFKK